MTSKASNTSQICRHDKDTITVRGRDLVRDLMGKINFTEMILLQLTGSMPTPAQATILDAVLVTIMEHGLIPSALVSRLTIYGAPESVQGAVAAGLLGVGDRFAGTASSCAGLLEALVAVPAGKREVLAQDLVRELREKKQAVPGFGHPIHTDGDPRVARLLEIVQSADTGGDYIAALDSLVPAVEQVTGKKLVINVSAAIAAALGEAGVDARAMRGLILTARCAGLAGHIFEEMQSPLAETAWRSAEEKVK
jgi:citrate synthase